LLIEFIVAYVLIGLMISTLLNNKVKLTKFEWLIFTFGWLPIMLILFIGLRR